MAILRLIFLISILSHFNLRADTIKLKDGKIVEGRILSESENEVIIKTQSGNQEINKRRISSIKIGYLSIGSCYTLEQNKKERICSKQLYQITLEKVKFVTRDASDPPEIILLKDLSELEILKNEGEEIISFLVEGMSFEFILKQKQIQGKIIQKKENSILVLNESGNTIEIREEEIVSASLRKKIVRVDRFLSVPNLDPKKGNVEAKFYHYLFPGTGQYERGEKRKSILYFSSFFLLAAGAWNQHSEARESTSKQHYLLLPNENGFYVLNDFTKSKNTFESHQRNYYILAGGLLFTFILNALDLKSGYSDKHKMSFDFMMQPDGNNRMTSSIQFEYSVRF